MVDLLNFCGQDELYPDFHEPFSHKAHTYATDGSICVRIERTGFRYKEGDVERCSLLNEFMDRKHRFEEIPAFTIPALDFAEETMEIGSMDLIVPRAVSLPGLGDGIGINICYLSWIINWLQRPLISFGCRDDNGPVAFSFTGGKGLVMPMSLN